MPKPYETPLPKSIKVLWVTDGEFRQFDKERKSASGYFATRLDASSSKLRVISHFHPRTTGGALKLEFFGISGPCVVRRSVSMDKGLSRAPRTRKVWLRTVAETRRIIDGHLQKSCKTSS